MYVIGTSGAEQRPPHCILPMSFRRLASRYESDLVPARGTRRACPEGGNGMAQNDTETETESFEDVISAEGGAFRLTAEQRVKVTAFYAGKGLTGEDLTSAVDVF